MLEEDLPTLCSKFCLGGIECRESGTEAEIALAGLGQKRSGWKFCQCHAHDRLDLGEFGCAGSENTILAVGACRFSNPPSFKWHASALQDSSGSKVAGS